MANQYRSVVFSALVGKTLKSCVVDRKNDEILFETCEGYTYKLYHDQDCCESVQIEDVVGDVDDLVGTPILQAEEASNSGQHEQYDSFTWTFYKLATSKGYVDIRFHGSSNGYYSEGVSFVTNEPASAKTTPQYPWDLPPEVTPSAAEQEWKDWISRSIPAKSA